jgi:multiple sugar transport system permease protein
MKIVKKRRPLSRARIIRSSMIYSVAGCFVLWILFPIWYTISSSFTQPSKIGARPTPFWPANPTLDNYRIVLGIPVTDEDCVPGMEIN